MKRIISLTLGTLLLTFVGMTSTGEAARWYGRYHYAPYHSYWGGHYAPRYHSYPRYRYHYGRPYYYGYGYGYPYGYRYGYGYRGGVSVPGFSVWW